MKTIGYLRFKEGFGLRRPVRIGTGPTARIRNRYEEYNKGQLIPLYANPVADYQGVYSLFISEGVVELLDANMKPITWDKINKLCKKKDEPAQRPVTVQKVKAVTRPVRRVRKKKDG